MPRASTAGRVVRTTNLLGQATTFEYNALSALTKTTDALGGQTAFTYDANRNLLTLTDARNNVTTYTYNRMDRVATRTDTLNRGESYVYDANGNLRDAETMVRRVGQRLRTASPTTQPILQRAQHQLEQWRPLVLRVLRQTRARVLSGDTHVPDKVLSIFEPHTQTISKGKIAKPNEFGNLVTIQARSRTSDHHGLRGPCHATGRRHVVDSPTVLLPAVALRKARFRLQARTWTTIFAA